MKTPKCWKKTRDTKNLVTFEHVCSQYNGEIVQVYKNDSFYPPWRATHNSGRKIVEDDLKKTKEAAMKSAYGFMRKVKGCL